MYHFPNRLNFFEMAQLFFPYNIIKCCVLVSGSCIASNCCHKTSATSLESEVQVVSDLAESVIYSH